MHLHMKTTRASPCKASKLIADIPEEPINVVLVLLCIGVESTFKFFT